MKMCEKATRYPTIKNNCKISGSSDLLTFLPHCALQQHLAINLPILQWDQQAWLELWITQGEGTEDKKDRSDRSMIIWSMEIRFLNLEMSLYTTVRHLKPVAFLHFLAIVESRVLQETHSEWEYRNNPFYKYPWV